MVRLSSILETYSMRIWWVKIWSCYIFITMYINWFHSLILQVSFFVLGFTRTALEVRGSQIPLTVIPAIQNIPHIVSRVYTYACVCWKYNWVLLEDYNLDLKRHCLGQESYNREDCNCVDSEIGTVTFSYLK